MKQDTWTHSTTNAEYGTTGALGSPRAWLRRAFDTATLDDTTFQPGSLTPNEISVAGVWYKETDGFNIPVTGNHRELFRWFDIPAPEQMMRPRTRVPLVPAIGVCAAVPMHEVLHWLKVYKEHGAAYTWWNTPINSAARAANPLAGKRQRRQLDHARVYRLLDAGKNRSEIAELLDFPKENIDYVIRKWKLGISLDTKHQKPRIDVQALIRDHGAGATANDLSVMYGTTPAYVYKLIKNSKCQNQDQQ